MRMKMFVSVPTITTDWGSVRLGAATQAWLRGLHPKWAEISMPSNVWVEELGEYVTRPHPYQGEEFDKVRERVSRLEDAVCLLAEIRAVNNQDLTEF